MSKTRTIPTETWHGCYDGSWKGLIVPEAFSHPAKFAPGLIARILDEGLRRGWWKAGDLIADPFGGIGGGGIFAAYAGLQWVGVELEPRFVAWADQNFALHAAKWRTLGCPTPRMVQGDSRRFAELVGDTAGCICSPPYAEGLGHGGGQRDQVGRGDAKYVRSMTGGYSNAAGIVASPPYADSESRRAGGPRTRKPGDRARRIDGVHGYSGVVTSPPFNERRDGQGIAEHGQTTSGRALGRSTLAQGIVTSPPFSPDQPCASQTKLKGAIQGPAKRDTGMRMPGQIGELPSGDVAAVLTSPPYADSQVGSGKTGRKRWRGYTDIGGGTSADPARIDAMPAETYWQAVAAVYVECLSVLRPGGHMAIVVKDFVKKGKRVPLCEDTLRLFESLGFEPVLRVHAMLVKERRTPALNGEHIERRERKSFFRRLAEKKGSPKIDHEEVLVVRRTA